MIKQTIKSVKDSLLIHRSNGKSPAGIPLPPLAMRMGGEHFHSNEAFLSSAIAEVSRLKQLAGLDRDSRLLDWGCGAGRLGIGVAEHFGRIELYRGVDVQRALIAWADRHLGNREGFEFTHVDVANARYNPSGERARRIPAGTETFDVFYAYSVFSHLGGTDTAGYMQEIGRLLAPGGVGFVTAFVEDDVPDEEENPPGYGPMTWSGPLHCVRFERSHFERFVNEAGLLVESCQHGQETDGQSLYILRKPSQPSRGSAPQQTGR